MFDPDDAFSDWACRLARQRLAEPLPRRWSHVDGVVALARNIQGAYGEEGELLVAAAALHDVGWAPDLALSGFPALDGARFLVGLGAPARLVNLVANYSCARVEAQLRGRLEEMAQFPDEASKVRDALWYCDTSIGPDGVRMPVAARLAEARVRYADDPLGERFFAAIQPELLAAAARTETLLASAGCLPT
jgi:hypothetical protein